MRVREVIIWLLLRIYPYGWRREFGAEFEELLQHGPLGLPMIVNVAVGALCERAVDVFRRISGGSEMADGVLGARYDRLTKIVSVCVLTLLVAIPLMAIGDVRIAVVAALGSAAVIALSFAFSPRGYEVSGGAFRIKRLAGDVVFPLDGLSFIRDATAADFWGSVRLWGSGCVFGYCGWFWSKPLGLSRWYVTNRKRAVVIAAGDQVVLVSPEDHDEFVAAIRGTDARLLAANASSASGGLPVPVFSGAACTGLALALVAAAMLYAPGRPPVDLTQDSLVIRSRFYGMTVPAASVDVANVRVVELAAEPGWRPALRMNGFGNRYYRAGNFRTASGRSVKLFTTGSERLVLLPPSSPDGTPVLLDAAEPDRFAARVREEWRSR